MDDISQLVSLAVLLIVSAFFSGSETALFSLNYIERRKLDNNASPRLKIFIKKILKSPDEILITILTGNMLANIFASSVSEILGFELLHFETAVFTILIMTVVLLLFGEMTPKNLAVQNSLSFARFSVKILYYIYFLLFPLTKLLNIIKETFLSLFAENEKAEISKKVSLLRSAIKIGLREHVISEYEYKLLDSFIDFRDEYAENVMIPRNQIVGFDVRTDIETMLAGLTEISGSAKYSLIPIYRGDLDHIAGYIDIKDLIGWRIKSDSPKLLSNYIKPVHPVPETKMLSELVQEMRSLNTEMALIVDEYGGTAGIITFQNLIEDLFDYFYNDKNKQIRRISENKYFIAGSYQLKELEEFLKTEFDSNSKTISGFIMENLGAVPCNNDVVELGDFVFRVVKMDGNRVEEVECTVKK